MSRLGAPVDDTDRAVTEEGIEVRPAPDDDGWNQRVDRGETGTAFHYREFLEATAEHVDARLHRLVGYKGDQPVGLFPAFERRTGPFKTVFSPPPNAGLSQLGPVILHPDGAKYRRRERRTHRFVGATLRWIEEVLGPQYVHLRTHTAHHDARPFGWNGLDTTTRYTYLVDLTRSPEEVVGAFSSDARRNVRRTDDDAYRVERRGAAGAAAVVDHLARRHREQGLDPPVSGEFVASLFDRLPSDRVRATVCEVDGDYAGGLVTVEDDRTVYRWQGGARPERDVDVPVNDLLDWHVIRAAADRGRARYDLVGANTPALCEYKSKFGPRLATYHAAETDNLPLKAAARLYRRL
jgi:hypothetical protein